jgi:microcystin-dependent protein
MSCTNCFNGCTETVSDQCIKYTGNDIPALGILHGDTLLSVENTITSFLTTILAGTSITPTIDPSIICGLVSSNLPTCTQCDGISLNDIITAIIKSTCSLQSQITVINQTLTTLNSTYTTECLTGITNTSNTHEVLQTVITKLCSVSSDLESLISNIENNYSSNGAELNAQIANYLSSIPGANLVYSKMVPYSIVPFYPTPAFLAGKFSSTGAGIGDWQKIYLCNGQNNTPDLRGRTLVGANSMGSNPYTGSATNPLVTGNPNYGLGTTEGANTVTLGISQIPNHTHTTTVTITDPGHTHTYAISQNGGGGAAGYQGDASALASLTTGSSVTGLKGTGVGQNVFVTNAAEGGGNYHANIQPSIGVNYIMYIP